MNRKIQINMCVGLLLGSLCGLIALGVMNKQLVATWWWEQTRTLPEVVLLVSRDTYLGTQMADYYFDTGRRQEVYDIQRAQSLYKSVIALDSDVSWAWHQLARIAFLRSEYTKALQYIETYEELTNTPRPQVLYLKGVVLGFAGQSEQALEALEAYYEYDSSSWYIYNNLAWTHFQLGNFEAMDTVSEAGLKIHPNNPWLLMNRGLAQHNLGYTESAVHYIDESYKNAITLNPSDWSRTYPGNDPAVAVMGLAEFMAVLEANRTLIHKQNPLSTQKNIQ